MDRGNIGFAKLLTQVLLPLNEGALWWGRDDLLKETTKDAGKPYPGSDRDGHPLVFISDITVEELFHPLPGLIGFSNTYPRAFTAKGLSLEFGPDYTTEFSADYRPLIPFAELYSPAPDADRNQTSGSWHERSRLARNHHKPQLTPPELDQLRAWKNIADNLR